MNSEYKKTKDSKEKKGQSFLPPEAMKFAKQLGLDLNGLEPEAQHIWNHLNKLSMDSPLEYERFIADQMQLAKEEKELEAKGQKPKSSNRTFRPTAEFCVETTTTDGDGSIIRELASKGKSLFINICSSAIIEEPKDRQGKPIENDRSVADGLEIPLLIGPIRPVDDKANAIDVIFNPIIPSLCRKEKYFRGQILDLAQDWILEETELKFKKNSYEDITDAPYRGGLGDNKDIPVLFNIDENINNSENPAKSSQSGDNLHDILNSKPSSSAKANSNLKKEDSVLSSTGSLLKELHKDEDESTLKEIKTSVPFKPKDSKSSGSDQKPEEVKKSKPIIQEIGVTKSEQPVDITPPPPPMEEKSTKKVKEETKKKDILIEEKQVKKPTKFEIQQYQDILDRCEDELSSGPLDYSDKSNSILDDLTKVLMPKYELPGQLAKTASNSSTVKVDPPSSSSATSSNTLGSISAAKSVAPSVPKSDFVIETSHPNVANISAKIDKDGNGVATLVITITGFKADASISSLQLESSERDIKVQTALNIFENSSSITDNCTISIKVLNSSYSINKSLVKASWKKKIRTLLINAPL